MNAHHGELFSLLLPALAFGGVTGWTLRAWWDARARGDRVVGGIKELHPAPAPNFWEVTPTSES